MPTDAEDPPPPSSSLAPTEEPPPFSPTDYVQLACSGNHSVRVEISARGHNGTLHVREGQLWAAVSDAALGLGALRELAFLDEARVVCVSERVATVERNLPQRPAQELLLEAARALDELPRKKASESFEALMDAATDALLAKDYPRALICYQKAAELRPEDTTATTNLARLEEILSNRRMS